MYNIDNLTTNQGISNSRHINNYAIYTNDWLRDVINLSTPFLQVY